MSDLSALLGGIENLIGLAPKQAGASPITQGALPPVPGSAPMAAPPPQAAQNLIQRPPNDHSTSDRWLAALAGGPAGFARQMLGQHQQQRVSGAIQASMVNGQFDPDRYTDAMSKAGLPVSADDMSKLQEAAAKTAERRQKTLADRRAALAGIAAPLLQMEEPDRLLRRKDAVKALTGTGLFSPAEADDQLGDLSNEYLSGVLGIGVGGDKFQDNIRGEAQNAETGRHNLATEGLTGSSQDETGRHNRVEEGQGGARVSIEAQNADSNRMRATNEGSSPSKVIGAILDKIARGEALTDGEKRAVTTYSQDIRMGIPGEATSSAPAPAPRQGPAPARPQAARLAPPAAQAGNGTFSSPARVGSVQQFDSLPVGAWFVNPKDGRKMQKQH